MGFIDSATFRAQNRQHAANTRKFLAGGGLDNLGESKFNPNSPVEFTALESVLIKWGEILVEDFARELNNADANASGALTSSLRFEFEKLGKTYELRVPMASYFDYVNEGVQGIDSGKSINRTSPYKFKFASPSEAHVEALEKWIKEKNVTALITVPKGIVAEKIKPKSLAYAIGTSIKQRGLKATYFKKKTIEKHINKIKSEIAAAISDDIKVNILFE